MIPISISKFSSLNFDHKWRLGFQTPVVYEQKFRVGDTVRVQYSVPKQAPFRIIPQLVDRDTEEVTELTPSLISLENNDTYDVADVSFIAPGAGLFTFRIVQGTTPEHIAAYSDFCVEEDSSDTVLFGYENRRDEFDVFFRGRPFCFRVEGVFLPSERTFDVENETFRDQRYTLTQLSALPYSKQTLTVGGGYGVPYWVAEKINLILSMTDISINGIPYVRSEGAAPELTQLHNDYPLFVYKIELERKKTGYGLDADIFEAVPIVTSEGDEVTDSAGDTIMGVF